MRVTTLHIYRLLTLLLFTSLIVGCNSKGYQNLTARYNGYFYANQRLEEVYQAIEDGYQYNYNDILKVYPEIDSGTVNSNKSKLEDAFKKASRVIEFHKTSDYVDDGYLIVGKIRHLQGEFAFAVSTLQYINQTSEDPDMRHAALIVLMRTYMDAGDVENAEQVANYLDLEELSEQNLVDYKITSAFDHQRKGEIQEMTTNLAEVVTLLKDKDERSRINFILGQIFQQQGANAEAFEFYKTSLSGTPPYELDFHARLNMLQVSGFNGPSQISKIRDSYAKMLKDGKNKEYQDKIFYEMGLFEAKQANHKLALDNYLKAVAVEQPQPLQKSLSYLRAAELYYDTFENFELASAYYDSTITLLPKETPNYEIIQKRQEVLGDFVKNLKIINETDSLLSLAELSPVSLDAFLDIYLDEQEEKAKEEEKEARRAERVNTGINTTPRTSNTFGAPSDNTGQWYFYNDAALSQGQLQFRRAWGDRALEDNWRRSSKDTFSQSEEESTSDEPEEATTLEATLDDRGDTRAVEKAKLLEGIPTTPEAKEAAILKVQEAYFNLGDIYRNGLDREDKGAESYQTLVEKYPQTTYKLDALFALYSIYQPKDISRANRYKDQIIREFPDSLIAKILIDPQYLEKKEARSRRLQSIYASAYDAYEDGDYFKADQIINNALASFEDVDFLPTVELLAAILKSKTESLVSYKAALEAFVEKYPDGPLFEEAKNRLEGFSETASTSKPKDEEFLYSEDFKQNHLVVMIFNTELNERDSVSAAIDAFNKERFAKAIGLRVGYLSYDLGNNLGMLYISPFPTKASSENYHREFKKEVSSFLSVLDMNFNNFVISRDNFTTLVNEKKLAEYLSFFKRFYK